MHQQRHSRPSRSATASDVGGLATITIKTGPDRRFHPNTITVHPGPGAARPENRVQHAAGEPHNLTFDTFRAGTLPLIRPGQQTSTTFTAPAPGRYQFVCTIHVGADRRRWS